MMHRYLLSNKKSSFILDEYVKCGQFLSMTFYLFHPVPLNVRKGACVNLMPSKSHGTRNILETSVASLDIYV